MWWNPFRAIAYYAMALWKFLIIEKRWPFKFIDIRHRVINIIQGGRTERKNRDSIRQQQPQMPQTLRQRKYAQAEDCCEDQTVLNAHIQVQDQMQRTVEASKQMLYSVYGNVVSFIEEYESRTHKDTSLPRSKDKLPDQSGKTRDDVESIVQAQLLVFEMHSKACPSEVRGLVNKDLRKKTLIWAAVREERKLPMQETDVFICQLYEILVSGKTRHEILYQPKQAVSGKTMTKTLSQIMHGKQKAAALDEAFLQDSSKMASSPETRTADADFAFKLGASRLQRKCPSLKRYLDADVEMFDGDGPDDLK